jgi:hypothetical protein
VKDPRAKHVTDEAGVLTALGQSGWLVTPSNLSKFFAAHRNFDLGAGYRGMGIVVGDNLAGAMRKRW